MEHRQILDCYKALGVPRFSDMLTVKKGYRRLSLKWHPDRNKHPNAMSNMQILNRCYEILVKDKAGYDALIHRLMNPQPVRTTIYTFHGGANDTSTTGFTWTFNQ